MPERWRESAELERIGVSYNDARTQLMTSSQLGLTKTYHRFNSPDERDPAVLELRRLHGEMDQAVLRAYGWHDLADQAAEPGFCQFLLDYEEDDDSAASDSGSARQKKKPWRYRWPDDFRDEVLARLLELNEQRHQEEMLAVGAPLAKPKKQTANKNGDAKKASRNSLGEDTPLFDSSNQSGGR
jgi:hypothetical protein